jgi:hypothetical protein
MNDSTIPSGGSSGHPVGEIDDGTSGEGMASRFGSPFVTRPSTTVPSSRYSRRTTTADNYDDIFVRDSFLHDENIYDAVVVLKDDTLYSFKNAVGCLLLVIVVVVSVVVAIFQQKNENKMKEQPIIEGSDESTLSDLLDIPTNNVTYIAHRGVCFSNRTELMVAINQYATQDCSNDGG